MNSSLYDDLQAYPINLSQGVLFAKTNKLPIILVLHNQCGEWSGWKDLYLCFFHEIIWKCFSFYFNPFMRKIRLYVIILFFQIRSLTISWYANILIFLQLKNILTFILILKWQYIKLSELTYFLSIFLTYFTH